MLKKNPKEDAKLNAIKGMRQIASDAMKDGLKGKLSKVSVVADDPKHLKEGLDKAKELLNKSPLDAAPDEASVEEEAHETPAEEASESPEEESKETDPTPEEEAMSADELDEKIKKLLALKQEKKMNG